MKKITIIIKNTQGNVTTLWVASLPVFAILFMFIGSLAVAWMSHSNSQVAGDAASLAATKKMDGWISGDLAAWLDLHKDNYQEAMGNDAKREAFIRWSVARHRGELVRVVKKYVDKHGAKGKGLITSRSGRLEVQAGTPFKSILAKEYFVKYDIRGSGSGPSRYYLDGISDGAVHVKYNR
ncbi:hypothetical protein SAMN05444487_10784 [Marininema mesophilum]|uniref:Flp pilus-assembly TadE/G-like n=1 Tax=Marininema mesophilum TaxID=1048340 RepID=A0A1H2X5W9_9BACL|nr:hypothetical protein [Marininema mesophilum]SDW87884.1 hypothetical protein SAMN05444487_10784 [Marininema mesophilum]